ncbi:MAG: 23S rRNA (adenine(2503)-C(2))-methyltransferase RlmN [Brevinema sp.]
MNTKTSLLEFDPLNLQTLLASKGFPKYKAQNILQWIYTRSTFDFQQMSDLSKKERTLLQEEFDIITLTKEQIQVSNDGTLKFLFKAQDDMKIETVMIPNEDDSRYTICVSSQIGCALRCSFCATGLLGYKRDLSISEIISQILLVDAEIKKIHKLDPNKRAIDNIVFMGMGEPFLNYDPVIKSVEIINDQNAFDIGTRRITISTSGIIEGIEKFAYAKGQVRLAISLHAANHEKRKNIMPVARKENTRQMLDAVRYYQEKTNRRITIEYILIEGFNNFEEDVLALKHELKNIKYNLNLIPLNPVPSLPYDAPTQGCIKDFTARLQRHSIPYVLRISKGRDIDAACGQLALRNKQSS